MACIVSFRTDSFRNVYFPKRTSIRNIKIEDDSQLDTNSLVVIDSDDYEIANEKMTSLLVNPSLKKEYDQVYSSLEKGYKDINKKIKSLSGVELQTSLFDLKTSNLNDIQNAQQTSFDMINRYGVHIFTHKLKKLYLIGGINSLLPFFDLIFIKHNELLTTTTFELLCKLIAELCIKSKANLLDACQTNFFSAFGLFLQKIPSEF